MGEPKSGRGVVEVFLRLIILLLLALYKVDVGHMTVVCESRHLAIRSKNRDIANVDIAVGLMKQQIEDLCTVCQTLISTDISMGIYMPRTSGNQ